MKNKGLDELTKKMIAERRAWSEVAATILAKDGENSAGHKRDCLCLNWACILARKILLFVDAAVERRIEAMLEAARNENDDFASNLDRVGK